MHPIVAGSGSVGTTIVVCSAALSHQVWTIDTTTSLRPSTTARHGFTNHDSTSLVSLYGGDQLRATTVLAAICETDVTSLALPTLANHNDSTDLDAMKDGAASVDPVLAGKGTTIWWSLTGARSSGGRVTHR